MFLTTRSSTAMSTSIMSSLQTMTMVTMRLSYQGSESHSIWGMSKWGTSKGSNGGIPRSGMPGDSFCDDDDGDGGSPQSYHLASVTWWAQGCPLCIGRYCRLPKYLSHSAQSCSCWEQEQIFICEAQIWTWPRQNTTVQLVSQCDMIRVGKDILGGGLFT